MCEALRELMKEDLDEAARIGEERGRELGEVHGREIGQEIGKEIGKEELILGSLKKHTPEAIAEFLGIPLEDVKAVEKKFLAAK